MGVLCGYASVSENGTVNGAVGDQTGKEVKTSAYYNFGQNKLIRFKDSAKGALAAKAMTAICNNNNIGYGQSNRTTLYKECERIGWDINRIGEIQPCNSDCSEVALCAINFAYGKEAIPASAYTGNIVKLCTNTGFFDVITSFTEATLQTGDMPIKEGKHIIMALQNGSSVGSTTKTVATSSSTTSKCNSHLRDLQGAITADKIATLTADGLYGIHTDTALKKIVVSKGKTGNVVAWVQCRVGCNPDGNDGDKTTTAIKVYQKRKGLKVDGCAGYNTIRSLLRDYGCAC